MAPGRDRLVFHGSLARRIVEDAEQIRTGGAGGRFLAVTGTAQSGRSTLLRSLADGFEEAGWRVVGREVRDGVLVAPRSEGLRRAGWAIQAAKVVSAGIQVAGGPVGSLLALIAEVATGAHMAAGEQAAATDDEYVQLNGLTVALERAASTAPLVLLIDDADDLDRSDVWWDVLLGAQVPDLVADLPLICVVGAERSSVARGSHAWDVLDALLADGTAEEVRLGPLDRAAVTEALGAVEPNLADQLLALAQRRPGWVAGLWESWRDEELVVRRDGRWEFGTDGYARARGTAVYRWVETSLHALLPARRRYDRALEILELGALEGPHFTAEVVAAMLSTDVEDLIDWLDDHLAAPDDDEGTSVVVEDGFVVRSGGEPLCRYRFRSLLAAGALREKVLRSTSGTALAGRYARTLADVYRWSAPGEAAMAVVRLATHAGDTKLVEETWARANRLVGVAEAARLGAFLAKRLGRKAVSTEELVVRVARLNEVNSLITGRWDNEETNRLCQAALEAARKVVAVEERVSPDGRSAHLTLLIHGLELAGQAATTDQDWDRGALLYEEAAERSATTRERLWTANLLRLAAQAQVGLEPADPQRAAAAVGSLKSALDFVGRDTSLAALRAKAYIHANLVLALGRSVSTRLEGARNLAQSVTVLGGVDLREVESSSVVMTVLDSAKDLAIARGDVAWLEEFVERQLGCRVNTGHRIGLLISLSTARHVRHKPLDAAFNACQALRLAQERGRQSEGWALFALARSAAQLEHPSAVAFALMSCSWLSSTTMDQQMASQLLAQHRATFARLDENGRREIAECYRRDRGAALVREAFGIDMADVDQANEQLGRADPTELRGYLAMVGEYAAQVIAAEERAATP